MSCTPLPKAAKPVWSKQLTELPYRQRSGRRGAVEEHLGKSRVPFCIQPCLDDFRGQSVDNLFWQPILVGANSNAEGMFVMAGVTPLLVIVKIVTTKPRAVRRAGAVAQGKPRRQCSILYIEIRSQQIRLRAKEKRRRR